MQLERLQELDKSSHKTSEKPLINAKEVIPHIEKVEIGIGTTPSMYNIDETQYKSQVATADFSFLKIHQDSRIMTQERDKDLAQTTDMADIEFNSSNFEKSQFFNSP